jgi:hypothetical protein
MKYSKLERSKHMNTMVPSDPVGIRKVQSLLREATQANLSSFHKAGAISARKVTLQEVLDLKKSKNCSMIIPFSDRKVLRELPYRKFKEYVFEMISLREFDNDHLEEEWYPIGKKANKIPQNASLPSEVAPPMKVIRFYINFRTLARDGRNLEFLRQRIFGDYEKVYCSPDFAGTLDVHLRGNFEIPGLFQTLDKTMGIKGIERIESIEEDSCIVTGSNLDDTVLLPGIVSKSILTFDLKETANSLGIEAAREMIKRLLPDGALIADIMTWTGELSSFTKRAITDPFLSMALEKPQVTIKESVKKKNKACKMSLHSEFMVGISPSIGTHDNDFELVLN